MSISNCTKMPFATALFIASHLSQSHFNKSCLTLISSVLAPDVKHEDRCNEQKRHDQHWHGTHFNARRVVGIEPPHATGACAGISVPSGGGYSRFPLSDGAAATCSWRYGLTGRPSNGSHGSGTRCGGHCANLMANNLGEYRKICSGNAAGSACCRNVPNISTAFAFWKFSEIHSLYRWKRVNEMRSTDNSSSATAT